MFNQSVVARAGLVGIPEAEKSNDFRRRTGAGEPEDIRDLDLMSELAMLCAVSSRAPCTSQNRLVIRLGNNEQI